MISENEPFDLSKYRQLQVGEFIDVGDIWSRTTKPFRWEEINNSTVASGVKLLGLMWLDSYPLVFRKK